MFTKSKFKKKDFYFLRKDQPIQTQGTVSAFIVGIAYIMKGPTRWGFPICLLEAALIQLLYLVLTPYLG